MDRQYTQVYFPSMITITEVKAESTRLPCHVPEELEGKLYIIIDAIDTPESSKRDDFSEVLCVGKSSKLGAELEVHYGTCKNWYLSDDGKYFELRIKGCHQIKPEELEVMKFRITYSNRCP